MPTLFITSSGTDIGKTFVGCRLLGALPPGISVRCLKPVVSGYAPDAAEDSDPGRLLRAQGRTVDAARIDAISPWRFRAPLSADMAAAREGRAIPFDALIDFCRPRGGTELTLIEGVGGVMAPIDDRHTVLDWIAALQARVLLVVGSYLGSLSHSLTATRALAGCGLDIVAIVVSQSREEPVATAETASALERFVGGVPVVTLPRRQDASAAELGRIVRERLNLG